MQITIFIGDSYANLKFKNEKISRKNAVAGKIHRAKELLSKAVYCLVGVEPDLKSRLENAAVEVGFVDADSFDDPAVEQRMSDLQKNLAAHGTYQSSIDQMDDTGRSNCAKEIVELYGAAVVQIAI